MPRLNCDDSPNIMTEVKSEIDYRLSNLSQQKISICIEGKFERNYREKSKNERDISNADRMSIFINNDEDKL